MAKQLTFQEKYKMKFPSSMIERICLDIASVKNGAAVARKYSDLLDCWIGKDTVNKLFRTWQASEKKNSTEAFFRRAKHIYTAWKVCEQNICHF